MNKNKGITILLILLTGLIGALVWSNPSEADSVDILDSRSLTGNGGSIVRYSVITDTPWVTDSQNRLITYLTVVSFPLFIRDIHSVDVRVDITSDNKTWTISWYIYSIEDAGVTKSKTHWITPNSTELGLVGDQFLNASITTSLNFLEDQPLSFDPYTEFNNMKICNISMSRNDLRSPYIESITPSSGSTLHGKVGIKAKVWDQETDLSYVEFSPDGINWSPMTYKDGDYVFGWDTFNIIHNKSYSLYIRAMDTNGNFRAVVWTVTVTAPTLGDYIIKYYPLILISLGGIIALIILIKRRK